MASPYQNSFWDTSTIGTYNSAPINAVNNASYSGATGMTTAQMMTPANFTSATSANGNVNPGWSVATSSSATPSYSTWFMIPNGATTNQGYTRPMLMSEEFAYNTPLPINNAHQLQLVSANLSGNLIACK